MVCPGPAGRTALTEGSLARHARLQGGWPARHTLEAVPGTTSSRRSDPGQVLNATTHAKALPGSKPGATRGSAGPATSALREFRAARHAAPSAMRCHHRGGHLSHKRTTRLDLITLEQGPSFQRR